MKLLLSISILICAGNFVDNLRIICREFWTILRITKTVLLYVMTKKLTAFTKNKDKTVFPLFLIGAKNSADNFADNSGQFCS